MEPLISVIVPIYNVEGYLNECIDSIINQTYQNLEIILVDDGSPDRSGEICDDYAERDKRITVIHKDNEGLSSARNTGIIISKGNYISFVDSDDFISEYFIEILYKAIKKTGAMISSTGYRINRFINSNDNSISFTPNADVIEIDNLSVNEALELLLYQQIPSGAPLRLYHRDIFKDLRFPKGWIFEDVATVYKAFINSNSIALVDASIYAYRVREDGIVKSKFSEAKLVVIPITRNMFEEVSRYSSSLVQAAASRAFAQNFHVFLQIPSDDKKNLNEVYKELKKYRSLVLKDQNKHIRKKNKLGAFFSYFGMRSAYVLGRLYLYFR
ncbi:MAG: glycosyltransferase family 2 protein [Lachnospiraceae bacterium]|nr:glycosyltransferase family 2 protein [Lachnospiraceae bacterium]